MLKYYYHYVGLIGVGSAGLFFCRLAPAVFHGTDILTLAPSLDIPLRYEKSQRKTRQRPAVKITLCQKTCSLSKAKTKRTSSELPVHQYVSKQNILSTLEEIIDIFIYFIIIM